MLPAHAALYRDLPPPAASHLASRLVEHGLVSPAVVRSTVGDDLGRVDGPTIASWCHDLSHAQVVLCLARDNSPVGLDAIEHLLRRPIYLCARGETGEVLTDIEGRPLPLPLGHRRGEAPSSLPVPPMRTVRTSRNFRRDPRIIVYVAPNPKQPSSSAWERYEHYRVGLSVEQVRLVGVTTADIDHDVRRGFIRVALPQDVPADLVRQDLSDG